MRVLIVDTCYPAFLDQHYRARPELRDASYTDQWHHLMKTRFGTSDAYSHNLAKAGIEAHEVVVNAEPLQSAWEREHGTAASELDQASWFRADVVYFQNLHQPSYRTLTELRRRGLLVVGQIASAAPPHERLRSFDLLLTSFPHFVERFRKLGVSAEYLKIAFDERVLAELPASEPSRDVVFVGALNGLRHRRGNRAIARAARALPIEVWGYDLRGWLPGSPIRRSYRGEAWGLEMYGVLRSARISLNRHIAEAGDFANNMRLFEATGVGSLLLTDAKRNLAELFEPGVEVVAYEDARDLVEKARHLLAHEDERAAIAQAGQARTLRDHTYAARMQELAGILRKHVS